MKVKGLDGRIRNWKMKSNPSKSPSSYHLRARTLLERLFPLEPRLEEVSLPGSKSLRCDFYLPKRKLMVEVHGEQHYGFVQRFHEAFLGFLKSKQRDENKIEWAEINGIDLIELPHYETDDEWKRRLQA